MSDVWAAPAEDSPLTRFVGTVSKERGKELGVPGVAVIYTGTVEAILHGGVLEVHRSGVVERCPSAQVRALPVQGSIVLWRPMQGPVLLDATTAIHGAPDAFAAALAAERGGSLALQPLPTIEGLGLLRVPPRFVFLRQQLAMMLYATMFLAPLFALLAIMVPLVSAGALGVAVASGLAARRLSHTAEVIRWVPVDVAATQDGLRVAYGPCATWLPHGIDLEADAESLWLLIDDQPVFGLHRTPPIEELVRSVAQRSQNANE